jgi:hypothetical protein
MRPIDVCTPKPFQLEHSCFVVSQRGWPTRAVPCGIARGPPSYPTRLAVRRARSGECLFRAPWSPVRRRALTYTGRLGAARCERGWGEHRFTTGLSLRRLVGALERRDSSSARNPKPARLWHPCRLLHPACSGPHFIGHLALVWRPPRSVPRGPRERRALYRPRIPSTGSRSARPARAEARTNPRSPRRE